MYFVDLGEKGEIDYYHFEFEQYKEATEFAKILIDNGYCVTMRFYETEE